MSDAQLLLGIDTSGSEGSLALGRMDADTVSLLHLAMLTGRHYSDEIIPRLKKLLSDSSVALTGLGAIVVVHGPGSFTGLRVGIGTAKALAEAVGVPVLALSRLAALAGSDVEAAAVLDAGRDESYLRLPSGKESVASPMEIVEAVGDLTVRVCEPHVLVQLEALKKLASLQVEMVSTPTAWEAILLAADRVRSKDFDDVATLDANYVRRPYANMAGPV